MLDTYHQHRAEHPSGLCQVSETSTERGPNQMCGGQRGRRDRRGGGDSNVPSQSEVDACRHNSLYWYSQEEYQTLNSAEKQKLWQLK